MSFKIVPAVKYLLDKNYLNCIILFDIGQKLFTWIKVPVVDSNDKIIDFVKYQDFYGKFFYLYIHLSIAIK